MHDPERAEETAEARRLGGIRRRRERTLAGAYGLAGVRTVEDLLRVVEIAVFNLLGAENSIAPGARPPRMRRSSGRSSWRPASSQSASKPWRQPSARTRRRVSRGPLRAACSTRTTCDPGPSPRQARSQPHTHRGCPRLARRGTGLMRRCPSISPRSPTHRRRPGPSGASPRRSRRPCARRRRARPRRSGRRSEVPWATPGSSSSWSSSSTSRRARSATCEGLRWALLSKWLGLLSAEAELAERTRLGDPEHAASEAHDWRQTLVTALTCLYEEAAARAVAGAPVLRGAGGALPGPGTGVG